jgi:hypothetical protein
VLSATNWAHHLHTRGGFEGYLGVSSEQKRLEGHGLQHWVEFYTDYGVSLQKRFFGHFLKGQETGWESRPPVALRVRRVDGTFTERTASGWPVPETRWTELYLDIEQRKLAPKPPEGEQQGSFEAMGDGLTFWTDPLEHDTERSARPTPGAVSRTGPGTPSTSASRSSPACRWMSTSRSGRSPCSSRRATGSGYRSSAATSSFPATARSSAARPRWTPAERAAGCSLPFLEPGV